MSTREAVLTRIATALADVPATETPDSVEVPRAYRRSHAGADLVEQFMDRVADYRATVILTTAEHAPRTIAGALAERGVESVVVPDGFPAELLPEGERTRLGDTPRLSIDTLESAEAVLTTAAAGIAVTGTLVLDAGAGQGRRALTLLPDYHVCIVYEEQIVGDVPDALARLDPTAPLTFISGPSATSDIELDRVEGVHGPRTLDVIIIAEQPDEEPS